MKKRIATAAVIIALLGVMLLPLAMSHVSGQTVALLDCLPQGQWVEFDGGGASVSTDGGNVDHRREEFHVPDEILDTTPENVQTVLADCNVKLGPKHKHSRDKEESFKYKFKDEDGQPFFLKICKDGCIFISHRLEADLHDNGEAYEALDAVFANYHEVRAFYEEGKYAVAECLPQGQWLEFSGEQTVSGQVQPLDMTDTTPDEVRNAFEQCYIRQGDYPAAEGENSFRYQFKTEDGQDCQIQVYEGGCVLITLDGLTTAYYDANHSIDVYWNLDVRFGSEGNT